MRSNWGDRLPCLALVGTFKFPDHSATSRRVLALAKLIQAVGTEVIIGSADPTSTLLPEVVAGSPLRVVHLSELPQPSTPRLLRAARQFLWGGRATSWLETLRPRPTAVLLYGGYSPFSIWLLNFRRTTQVPMIVDAVEWYEPTHVPGGRFGPFRLNVELALRVLFPRMQHVIAISRYLQRYFEGKGCHVLYLPAILDVEEIAPNLRPRLGGGPLQLVYTGTPGKKDLLNPMLEAILRLDPGGSRVRFSIVGPSHEEILRLPALRNRGITCLPPCLDAPGYVTHAEAIAQVYRADFSVLLRHRKRYAMAGFPTKVPESLAAGTPVICNLTSDLGDYLKDGLHALVCQEPTPEACLGALERALSLTATQQIGMRQECRWLAESRFDFRAHLEAMNRFLLDLQQA